MDERGGSQSWLGLNQYVPREPFSGFHCRKERWAVLVCHRRAGKTVACVADLISDAIFTRKQDARYAYIAPQFNQAKDVAWLYVKRLTHDIKGTTYNEAELRANLPNGAQVRLFGADNPDRLRGMYLDGVVLDEHADMKPRVWGEVVRPMLADRAGWAAFIGTPKGHNEFYWTWERAKKDKEYFSMMLRASESGILSSAEIDAMKRGMSVDQVEQELECSFEAAIMGAYYGREMVAAERDNRICTVDYDPALPVYTAWDIGYRDDTAIWWYQVIRSEIHVIDYHASSGQTLGFYADLIAEKPYKYATHYLPHDARAKTLASGGKSIIEQLVLLLGHDKLSIVPNLDIQDGIQAARRAIATSWFDETKCYDGLEALRQYQREYDEDKKAFRERPRHDWTSHAADAFRMLAVAWQKQEIVAPRDDRKSVVTVGDPGESFRRATLDELWKENERAQSRRARV